MGTHLSDSRSLQQARYIFSVGKMLRHHIFSSLSRFEGKKEDCQHSDLSMAQFNLIITVRNQGEITLSELAEKLGYDKKVVKAMSSKVYSDPSISGNRDNLMKEANKYLKN